MSGYTHRVTLEHIEMQHGWPAAIVAAPAWTGRGEPYEERRYVPERTAYRHVKSYGESGITTCSACHADVEPSDDYCARCGARLTHTEYEEVGKYAAGRG